MNNGEELELFRRSVRALVDADVRPHVRGWEAAGSVPRELFSRLGGLGFLGIRLSPEHGGGGLDFWYTAALIEELVRCGSVGVAVSVLAHAEFATKVIDRVGTTEQKETFLAPAVRGERIGALGVTEPDAGSDVAAIRTRAVPRGDDLVVDGAKTFITNGGIADFVTTAVRTGGPGSAGLSLLVIPTDARGFSRGRRLAKLGVHAADTAELAFEDCHVPRRYLLGPMNGGMKLILQGFEGERLVLALICCAQMRLMWEEARRYGHDRHAFGQPLLGFQTWRHRLADALTTIEAADALTARAIDRWVRSEPCNAEISMAKLFSSEAALRVAHDCAQIFGGSGYMEEQLIGRLLRDSLAFTIGAGTSEVMREIIARGTGLLPREDR
jgi:citronellyl-CoA dehydrogenase